MSAAQNAASAADSQTRPGSGILRLAPEDNIGVATRSIADGESLDLGGQIMLAPQAIPVGHKIAVQPISAGGAVRKYGMTIGTATCDIAAGQYVHTHNVRSNYLPTYTRDHRAQG
jgi:hypothetical protein